MQRHELRGLLTFQMGASLVFSIGLPIGISWLSTRHGWSQQGRGVANLVGLLPLMAGLALVAWANLEHLRIARRHGWRSEMIRFEASQYLIESGPYRCTRNPTYVSHLLVWLGWALILGSCAVAIATAVMWPALATIGLPYEQRQLAEKFGASYADYCSPSPRWISFPVQDRD
jgi:protein-S-isoprenylcysteine O-methyltransferase Ste14